VLCSRDWLNKLRDSLAKEEIKDRHSCSTVSLRFEENMEEVFAVSHDCLISFSDLQLRVGQTDLSCVLKSSIRGNHAGMKSIPRIPPPKSMNHQTRSTYRNFQSPSS
jgi:hypothetical protein